MSNLEASTTAFMSTFNDGDYNEMLRLLSPNAVYIDPNGLKHTGVEEIGASLKSVFDGTLGNVSYQVTSTILDEVKHQALVTWTMVMTAADGAISAVDGLDILRFDEDKLVSKNAFCKAQELAIRAID